MRQHQRRLLQPPLLCGCTAPNDGTGLLCGRRRLMGTGMRSCRRSRSLPYFSNSGPPPPLPHSLPSLNHPTPPLLTSSPSLSFFLPSQAFLPSSTLVSTLLQVLFVFAFSTLEPPPPPPPSLTSFPPPHSSPLLLPSLSSALLPCLHPSCSPLLHSLPCRWQRVQLLH